MVIRFSAITGAAIPMVNTAEEAESAVKNAKYPPRGKRGYGYSRVNAYGMNFDAYIKAANNTVAIIAQIEHRNGIENLDAILEVEDIDGVFIGPLDLSGSYGKAGCLDCPEMRSAQERYLNACRKHKKSAGIHIVRPDEDSIRQTIRQGYKLIGLGLDGVFLETAARNTAASLRRFRNKKSE